MFLKTVIISIIKPRLSTIIKKVYVSSLLILTYVLNIETIKIKQPIFRMLDRYVWNDNSNYKMTFFSIIFGKHAVCYEMDEIFKKSLATV